MPKKAPKLSPQEEAELARQAEEEEEARLKKDEEERLELEARREEAKQAREVYENAAEDIAATKQHLFVLKKDRLASAISQQSVVNEAYKWDHYVQCLSTESPNLWIPADITSYIARQENRVAQNATQALDQHMTDVQALQSIIGQCIELREVCDGNGNMTGVQHFGGVQALLEEACQRKVDHISGCLRDTIWGSEKYDECNNKYITHERDTLKVSYWININKNPRFNTINFTAKDRIGLPKSLCISPISMTFVQADNDTGLGIQGENVPTLRAMVEKEAREAEAAQAEARAQAEAAAEAEAAAAAAAAAADADAPENEAVAAANASAESTPKATPASGDGTSPKGSSEGEVSEEAEQEPEDDILDTDSVLDIEDESDGSGDVTPGDGAYEFSVDEALYCATGKVVSITMATVPVEPWTYKNWSIRAASTAGSSKTLPYPLDSAKASSGAGGGEEVVTEDVPPLKVTLDFPQAALVSLDKLKAARWDETRGLWSTKDISVSATDPEQGSITMDTLNLGKFRVFQERVNEALFPLSGWELCPIGARKARFSLQGQSMSVVLIVEDSTCLVESISTMDELPTSLTTPSAPDALLRAMQCAGVNVAAGRVGLQHFVKGLKCKHIQPEFDIYFGMSLFAGTHMFRHDKDNVHRCRSMLLQAKRAEDEEWSRIMWNGHCTYEINADADGTGRYFKEIVEGGKLHGDLYHLLNSKGGADSAGAGAAEAKAAPGAAPDFEKTVFRLLTCTMPLCAQGLHSGPRQTTADKARVGADGADSTADESGGNAGASQGANAGTDSGEAAPAAEQ